MKYLTIIILIVSILTSADECGDLINHEEYTKIFIGEVIKGNKTVYENAEFKVIEGIKGKLKNMELVHNKGTKTSSWIFGRKQVYLICTINDTIQPCSHTIPLISIDSLDIESHLGLNKKANKIN